MTKLNSFVQLFNSKKTLITGHTGFKGSWLSAWLHLLGADVYGVSLDSPPSSPSHFDVAELSEIVEDQRVDIRNPNELSECVNDIKPDFVFHLAAQALVRESFNDPVATYHTNVLGH